MIQVMIVIVLLLVVVPSSVFWVDIVAELLHQTTTTIWTSVTCVGLGSVVLAARLTKNAKR